MAAWRVEAPHYSHLGCPSVCPELMMRMLLIGYLHSIRSERRLCQEVKMNLAYRWFCGLGLEDKVPHHSTFLGEPSRALPGERYPAQGVRGGGLRLHDGGIWSAARVLRSMPRVIEANASRFQRVEGAEVDWTTEQRARRPVSEYLVALESENPPINPKQKPKAMSPSDPSAAWTTRGRHKVMFGYSLNYLIDMENAVILDVEATPTRISKEVDATETMIETGSRTVCPQARSPGRRCRLWHGRDARLVGRARYRAAHPGVGQVQAQATAPSQGRTSAMTKSAISTSARADKTIDNDRNAHSE